MADLSTSYLGISIKSPVIAGACGFTGNIRNLEACEKNGAGAVVLKSLFEEQILSEISEAYDKAGAQAGYPEMSDYISNYTQQHSIEEYLELIRAAKKAIRIPVIASINCLSFSNWTDYAEKIQEAGADGLEINVFFLPDIWTKTSQEYEQIYIDIANQLRKKLTIPVAFKISYHFTALANFIHRLSATGISGVVLFNRFLPIDINIETEKAFTSGKRYSTPEEIAHTLRWVALLSDKKKNPCDVIASTGVHDFQAAIKLLLAGATAVQICSALYLHGAEIISTLNQGIAGWMKQHNYSTLRQFRGTLNHQDASDQTMFQRFQYLKYNSATE